MQKVLIAGDIQSNLDFLVEKINQFTLKNQTFDFILCVGKTLSKASISNYLSGTKKFPLPLYFIDTSEISPALHSLYPNGQQLGHNIYFLGRSGIKDINGIKIAFLSGVHNDIASFLFSNRGLDQGPHLYNGGYYTDKEIQKIIQDQADLKCEKGVDIFLSSEWPQGFNNNLDNSFTTAISNCSSDVSKLALILKPRYHFAALENLFYQRPPYLNAEGVHITRFIALGKVPRDNIQTKEKYMYAVQLVPLMNLSKEDLLAQSIDTTPNPYKNLDTQRDSGHMLENMNIMTGKSKEESEQFEDIKENIPLFFFGFDRKTSDTDIFDFLSRWGEIKDFQLMYDENHSHLISLQHASI